MNKTKIFQFSKKIVVAVTTCVTILCCVAILLCWHGKNTDAIVSIIRAYIEYSMVVFVSYSGNSVAQKFLISKNKVVQAKVEQPQAQG